MNDLYRVGFATVDITPPHPVGIPLGGFDFNRRAEGVRDPLYARAVHIDDGRGGAITLVSVDSIGILRPTALAIRKRLRVAPPDSLWICATHSHAAPDTLGYYGPSFLGMLPIASGADPAYMAFLEARVAEAADEAARAAHESPPARVMLAELPIPDGLIHDLHGTSAWDRRMVVWTVWEAESPPTTATSERGQQSEGGGTSPRNPIRGVMVEFPCHPEVLWNRNKLISSDFVGVMCHALSQRLEGAPVVYFQGPLGGMVTPNIEENTPLDARVEMMDRLGAQFAFIALGGVAVPPISTQETRPSVNASLHQTPTANANPSPRLLSGPIRQLELEVALPVDNWRYRLIRFLGVIDRDFAKQRVTTSVRVARWGHLRLLGMPGEVLPRFSQALLHQAASVAESALPSLTIESKSGGRQPTGIGDGSPAPLPVIFGLVDDELGYFLPRVAFEKGSGYTYEPTVSPGPRSARLLHAACEEGWAKLGLVDSPPPPKDL